MLDINAIRENPDEIRAALLKRMDEVDFSEILVLDGKRRELIQKADALKSQRNKVSSDIPKMKCIP